MWQAGALSVGEPFLQLSKVESERRSRGHKVRPRRLLTMRPGPNRRAGRGGASFFGKALRKRRREGGGRGDAISLFKSASGTMCEINAAVLCTINQL